MEEEVTSSIESQDKDERDTSVVVKVGMTLRIISVNVSVS